MVHPAWGSRQTIEAGFASPVHPAKIMGCQEDSMESVSLQFSLAIIGAGWTDNRWVIALAVLLASVVLASISEVLTRHTLGRLASRTVSNMDDQIVEIMRRPIAMTFLLVGAWYSSISLMEGDLEKVPHVWRALLTSLGIIIWARVGMSSGRLFLFEA